MPVQPAYKTRADEVDDLVETVKNLIIPFIRSAEPSSSTSGSSKQYAAGDGVNGDQGQHPMTLVDYHAPKELQSILDLDLPSKGQGKDGLVNMTEKVLRYSVNTWDQGFMDKLYASTNAVGVAAELLTAALNTNVHVYQVSPVLTLIEKHVAKTLARMYGFTDPHSGGMSQPGGSAGNSSSIVIARNTLYPHTKTRGIGSDKYVLFTSQHGHYSLEKAAQMFGFGSDNVRSVPVDKTGRMDVSALRKMVVKSKEDGEVPFYVNATAGTTVLGSFDPFDEIAEVCKEHHLWMHVDGSWGGSVIFNKGIAEERLRGVEKADSIVMSPHKMLGVPVTCSFLLAKDMRKVWKAMTLPAGYLFHTSDSEEIFDLADLTPQCGRRGDALKFFLSWVYYGEEGLSEKIERAFELATRMQEQLSRSENVVMLSTMPPPCLQVCFYYAPERQLGDPTATSRRTEIMTERLMRRGFMVDYAPGENGKFFRIVINISTTEETVTRLVEMIEEVGRENTT
ncbi:glutamate decarboxylase [Kockovaella imperatae]|uniref:Glutamate decarboxylase n=1 Tax=Kockovaella imperatae TaxID=4999 RepID=A0A1Y1UNP3_9TREE|nr:glutamate decarboxylase [Kockovaella imperatae]ORX39124.1 glutamate decarboxylase [Kockovaella imperatae]